MKTADEALAMLDECSTLKVGYGTLEHKAMEGLAKQGKVVLLSRFLPRGARIYVCEYAKAMPMPESSDVVFPETRWIAPNGDPRHYEIRGNAGDGVTNQSYQWVILASPDYEQQVSSQAYASVVVAGRAARNELASQYGIKPEIESEIIQPVRHQRKTSRS
jgi:hypothetical protein